MDVRTPLTRIVLASSVVLALVAGSARAEDCTPQCNQLRHGCQREARLGMRGCMLQCRRGDARAYAECARGCLTPFRDARGACRAQVTDCAKSCTAAGGSASAAASPAAGGCRGQCEQKKAGCFRDATNAGRPCGRACAGTSDRRACLAACALTTRDATSKCTTSYQSCVAACGEVVVNKVAPH